MPNATPDPLLSDDLSVLLPLFPNEALWALLDGMGKHTPYILYGDGRATEARALPKGADLRPYAAAISTEVCWWASNAVHLAVGVVPPTWPEIVRDMAHKAGTDLATVAANAPAWRVEQALLDQLAAKWGAMTTKQREEATAQPGVDMNTAVGAALAAGGGAMALAEGAAAAVIGRAAPAALAAVPAAAMLAPVVAVAGAAWMLYGFAGPAFRVLGPATALVASTRQELRDQRMAAAFRED